MGNYDGLAESFPYYRIRKEYRRKHSLTNLGFDSRLVAYMRSPFDRLYNKERKSLSDS